MALDYSRLARDAAQRLHLLAKSGELVPLDSLMIVDLVTELEQVCGITIRAADVTEQTFASVDSIASLLERLSKAASAKAT